MSLTHVSIEWKGDERELPGHGIAKPGEVKQNIPFNIAESYRAQGLAKIILPKALKREVKK